MQRAAKNVRRGDRVVINGVTKTVTASPYEVEHEGLGTLVTLVFDDGSTLRRAPGAKLEVTPRATR